jgi:hypothetical protein
MTICETHDCTDTACYRVAYDDREKRVCRKCAEELIWVYDWKHVRLVEGTE